MDENPRPVIVSARKHYASPNLTIFGALKSVTAAGSPDDLENNPGLDSGNRG
jgi:hypothetical protein